MAADICKFESLVYRASSRTTQGYTEKPYLKENKSNRTCFLYVCVSSVSEHARCVQCPQEPAEGIRAPGAGVTDARGCLPT